MVIGDAGELSERLLEAASKAGADAADAVVRSGRTISVSVRAGALEQAESSEGIEFGLRVFVGCRQAVVSGSDNADASIAEMADRAVSMAREAPEDPYCGLAGAEQLAVDTDNGRLDLESPDPPPAADELEERALAMEAAALAVPGVSTVDSSGTTWGRSESAVAATNGFRGRRAGTFFGAGCTAISGDGLDMEREWHAERRIHGKDMPPPEEIGRIAGERAAARAGAGRPPTGAYPILFDERVAASLIGHLLAAMNGAAIVRGSSWLKDAMETPVLPGGCSLVENPFRQRVSGSRVYDAEGLPKAERKWVESGVLRSWILDLATSRKLGCDSTANASRGVGGPPSPSAGNVSLIGPSRSRGSLVSDMGAGLIVTSLMGASINPTTGDYSRGASGFWVENGEVGAPVNECTIAGNLRDMLLSIIAADDARPHLSHVVPSLLVEGLTIAGS